MQSPLTIFIKFLLSYQEDCIAEQQLPIFPEASEKWIICQVYDRSVTQVLRAEQQSVLQPCYQF